MDDGIDTGDILLQRGCRSPGPMATGTVLSAGGDAIPDSWSQSLDLIAGGTFDVRSQRTTPGTYFGGRREGDEWLDWSRSSVDAAQQGARR